METKIEVFAVEVGVELLKSHSEYDCYLVDLIYEKNLLKMSLFDENVLGFRTFEEAKSFVDEYVKNGVNNTYGFVFKPYIESFYNEDEINSFVHNKTLPAEIQTNNIIYINKKIEV